MAYLNYLFSVSSLLPFILPQCTCEYDTRVTSYLMREIWFDSHQQIDTNELQLENKCPKEIPRSMSLPSCISYILYSVHHTYQFYEWQPNTTKNFNNLITQKCFSRIFYHLSFDDVTSFFSVVGWNVKLREEYVWVCTLQASFILYCRALIKMIFVFNRRHSHSALCVIVEASVIAVAACVGDIVAFLWNKIIICKKTTAKLPPWTLTKNSFFCE